MTILPRHEEGSIEKLEAEAVKRIKSIDRERRFSNPRRQQIKCKHCDYLTLELCS